MRKHLLLSALALLVLSVSCSALSVDVPATIIVQQAQKDVPITIHNDTSTEQNYGIVFTAPVYAVISPSSGKLNAGKTTFATLSIAPKNELAGSIYEGVLEVELGQEKAFRKISVIFKEEAAKEEESGGQGGQFGFAGFASLLGSVLTWENAVNFALVMVAAVLLIAFIARFVKRLEAAK